MRTGQKQTKYMQATYLTVEGEVEHIKPKNKKHFKSEELKAFIGPYVEMIKLPKTKKYLIADENGKIKNLEINEVASAIWRANFPIEQYARNDGIILGNVIICDFDMIK